MPTVKENLKMWNFKHTWDKRGDEWSNQADFCNQPYDKWKKSLIENFVYKYINKNSTVLEIAPGYGRWTEHIIKRAKKVILVDLSPKCINHCKERFREYKNIDYYCNDGKSLDFLKNNSIDFIWSYDSFVHMEANVIENYLRQFSRVLKKGGITIIHHAGKSEGLLPLARFLDNFGKLGKVIKIQILFRRIRVGCRSDISREMIVKFSKKSNLLIVKQIDSWGRNNEYNCKLFGDWITILRKPH